MPGKNHNRVLKTALKYKNNLSMSVIPVRPDNKKPYVKWLKYQKESAGKDEIAGWFAKYPDAMVGIVTGKISGIMVIDCDSEKAYQDIRQSLPDPLETWVARSPRGYHIYFKYPEKGVSNSASIIDNVDVRGEGGYIIASPSIRSDGNSYAWVTSPDQCELANIPEEFCILYNIYNSFYKGGVVSESPQTTTKTTNDHKDHTFFSEGRRDNDLFHLANCLLKGGCEIDFTTKALEIIGQHLNPPFPKIEIELKIKSALNRSERVTKNITGEIREWVETTNGNFSTTDCHKELQLTTKTTMKAANMALLRLCEGSAPLLEKHGNKRGCYRKVETDVEIMDLSAEEEKPLNIRFPFKIHDMVNIMPGNIILVAGAPDAGKTAFLMNFVAWNMDNFDVHYFNSEMGVSELKMRLRGFDRPLESWKFTAYERSFNFVDVIKPGNGKINIIDFLEIHDNFWEVGGMINDIHKKLKGAVAVIAIQKQPGRDEGRGGNMTLEKPRLALAMDHGKIKIVKAKNWKDPMNNPRNQQYLFKTYKGCRFSQIRGWHYEE
jgi:hypothetical protein